MATPAPTKCIVSVIGARGVKAADRGGTSDPYAIFKFESTVNKAVTFKTRVRKKTLDPEWLETFIIPCVSEGDRLTISVWDHDRIGHDDFLGQNTVVFEKLKDEKKKTYPLEPRNKKDKNISGDIQLGFKYEQNATYVVNLHAEVKLGNLDVVRRGVSPENVNDRDRQQQTLLHVACYENNVDMVRLLLENKADVDVQDRNGWTPLHCAASAGRYDIVMLLMEHDADLNALNRDGTSVMHYLVRRFVPDAQKESFIAVLKTMIERGFDVNTQNKFGESPLHQACLRGNIPSIKLLLDSDAKVDAVNKIGESSLHYAVRAGHKEAVRLMAAAGADPNVRCDRGTVWDIASDEMKELLSTKQPAKLVVSCVRGSGVDDSHGGCFLEIKFGNDVQTSVIAEGDGKPEWNEDIEFSVGDSSTVVCTLKTGDGDEFLGEITVDLLDLDLPEGPWKETYKLRGNLHTKAKGKITLQFTYVEPGENVPQLKTARDERARERLRSSRNSSSSVSSSSSSSSSSSTTSSASSRRKAKLEKSKSSAMSKSSGSRRKNKPANLRQSAPVSGSSTASTSSSSKPTKQQRPAPLKRAGKEEEGTDDGKLIDTKDVREDLVKGSWEVEADELQIVEPPLGEGTFAKVYKGMYRNQEVAIKVLKSKVDAKQLDEFRKEFAIMSSIRSPNVVFFYGATIRPNLCMVMEFCHKGTLYDVLNDKSAVVDWPLFFKFAKDMVRGTWCLHSWKPQIVHRDLKTLNLLVDQNNTVKVCDFGQSRFTEGQASNSTLAKLRGTYHYCAPEVYFGKRFTTKSDVFSIGVILWELVVRVIRGIYQQPYSEFKQLVFDFQIIIQTAKKNLRPTIPETCPKPVKDLISVCWDPVAENRPECVELLDMLTDIEERFKKNEEDWNDTITHTGASADDD
mmetsp:Transcript_44626/g.112459  ORF Transcript_44626/g.112459 Transcript_44626/m.112459 type:complete len:909 (-) Transcript_44626:74-2800(-)|eukprot:CAMPEP_0177661620 /NCGR_PEP_ID=MMETSP0447-20121125/18800_1 /TAXON_ID=0 /ORGANISM="Stygamoeba regulata, Strain BSH-02190019" /LENGTH=908 /DNA_ID=CAMNT_0019167023 /DNA_START=309 /DNA_END=3035 /DNA_ORIENTATION=+